MDETLFATVLRNFQRVLRYILPDKMNALTHSVLGLWRHELTLTVQSAILKTLLRDYYLTTLLGPTLQKFF